MKELHEVFAKAAWPAPADAGEHARGQEGWLDAAAELSDRAAAARVRRLATGEAGQPALAAIFGNSPFLSHAALADPAFAADLLRDGPEAAFAALTAAPDEAADLPGLMTGLRVAKRRAALIIGVADIAGAWPVERVTAALSAFADLALQRAARHLLRKAAASGALRLLDPDTPERGCGLAVIGMGKLGARELNYSSDIDIIVLYDDERVAMDAPQEMQHLFVRLTRELVRILEERTGDGYVFRTDLRLRPDPGATPIALSMAAAETYYEGFGQNWERAAMIKARPVAGDLEAGAAFLQTLRPYIWRKHLDFAAIQDIHSIKRQINAHRGGAAVALAGHNIKLGRGGIREIEFFAQTQQLIWGGRDPGLRSPVTCEALAALAAAGRVKPEVAAELTEAYRFLRRVEHRLQMTDDRQTHTLPGDAAELARLATFLGYDSLERFAAEMLAVLRRVEKHYAELFEEAPTLAGPGNLVFTGTDDDPGTIETLTRLGFAEPSRASATIRGWHHGRYRAVRSARARELLTELMPAILKALAETPQPDAAFAAFDRFLGRLPSGVQIFSLFHANPRLLDLLAEVMGGAPQLAESLSAHPHLLDSVLSPAFLAPPPPLAAMTADLAAVLGQARDFQDVLDACRRWARERRFQVGVHLLRGLTDPEHAGAALADIADAVLAALQPAVETEFARAHGRIPGGHFAIVALGKLGGREMTVTSDLDLVFLYDVPNGIEGSDGEKPLPVSLYYTRLASRLTNAITALTGEGALYALDLRLRPSGNKGPLAADLSGFLDYARKEAWTWEHMALTRARPVTGPPELRARIMGAIRDVLTLPRDPAKLVADIAAMRALMAREHPPRSPWEIKHWRGGLIDTEFIVQLVQLRDAARRPGILHANTAAALEAAIAAGALDAADGETLRDALRLWHLVQGLLRLTVEAEFDPASAPEALKHALARGAGAADFTALEARVAATAERVHAIFERLIPPAAAGSLTG